MAKISSEQYFSLCTGVLVKDIKELALTLDYLSDEEFNHHVNEDKNDFSAWVSEVFGRNELAEEISKTTDRKEIQLALLKNLVK